MCNDNFFRGGIVFPNYTRYACCNPCCDGSVNAQRVDSITDNDNRCCGCCCCCCCCRGYGGNVGNVGGTSNHNCHHRCDDDDDNVGGVTDNTPCPCRGGW